MSNPDFCRDNPTRRNLVERNTALEPRVEAAGTDRKRCDGAADPADGSTAPRHVNEIPATIQSLSLMAVFIGFAGEVLRLGGVR